MTLENYNLVAGAQRILDSWGDVIKTACDGTGDAPSQDPDAGHGYCVELSNIQSICDIYHPLRAFNDFEFAVWVETGSQTFTFKIQTTYSGISAGGIELAVLYPNSDGQLSEVTNAPAISTRSSDTDWTQTLAVTFNPAAAGWAYFQIKLMEYQAGDEVYIWPVPVIT
jgi:hypothetical protein